MPQIVTMNSRNASDFQVKNWQATYLLTDYNRRVLESIHFSAWLTVYSMTSLQPLPFYKNILLQTSKNLGFFTKKGKTKST